MNDLTTPGRTCPLHYHYGPDTFRSPPPPQLRDLEVLYLVGGLYGNALALRQVLQLFDAETGRKCLVFNGDFHWFDADPATFSAIQQAVLAHTALRGNVETELAQPAPSADAGCGCAYPEWVQDAVVERSNRIMQRLWTTATASQRQELAALPMWQTATVGGLRIGIVHGDAQSLAGWGFAQEHLSQAQHRQQVKNWFESAQVDAFASSHTCLPVYQQLTLQHRPGPGWVFNNGAAGMPNFAGDSAGLITRMALAPLQGPLSRAHVEFRGLHIDALAIETDASQVQAAFLAQWPQGSPAYLSYFSRMVAGPNYHAQQIIRLEN